MPGTPGDRATNMDRGHGDRDTGQRCRGKEIVGDSNRRCSLGHFAFLSFLETFQLLILQVSWVWSSLTSRGTAEKMTIESTTDEFFIKIKSIPKIIDVYFNCSFRSPHFGEVHIRLSKNFQHSCSLDDKKWALSCQGNSNNTAADN